MSKLPSPGRFLENSPVLGDDFLLGVISSDAVHGALSAIARRVALGENVADAIVQNGDAEAIADLLGNKSTQIREETLDRIIDQASGEPTWHKPLVHRPDLHADAAKRIAEIVAGAASGRPGRTQPALTTIRLQPSKKLSCAASMPTFSRP